MSRFLAVILLLLFAASPLAAAKPIFAITGTSVAEGTIAKVIVTKNAKAASYSKITVTTVDVATNGAARANVDYKPVNTSITVGNSTLTVAIPVTTIARPGYQGNRSFTVHLVVTRNGVANPANASVVVLETEQPLPPPPPPPPPPATWTECAQENGVCSVVGTANVRYGFEPTWTAPRAVTGSIGCDNGVWGDPFVGIAKVCQTDGTPVLTPPPPVTQTCPDGSVIPITDTCPVPPPPVTSACKPLNMTASDPNPPSADMLCTATKTCHDYRIGLVSFIGDPVVEAGKQYYVVRGLLWGIGDDHVVAWVPRLPGTPTYEVVGFPGWTLGASGAYFNRSCFE